MWEERQCFGRTGSKWLIFHSLPKTTGSRRRTQSNSPASCCTAAVTPYCTERNGLQSPPSAPLSPHSSSPCVSQAEEVLPIPVPEAASWENAMDNISRENRMTSTAEAQQHGAGPERERDTHKHA